MKFIIKRSGRGVGNDNTNGLRRKKRNEKSMRIGNLPKEAAEERQRIVMELEQLVFSHPFNSASISLHPLLSSPIYPPHHDSPPSHKYLTVSNNLEAPPTPYRNRHRYWEFFNGRSLLDAMIPCTS